MIEGFHRVGISKSRVVWRDGVDDEETLWDGKTGVDGREVSLCPESGVVVPEVSPRIDSGVEVRELPGRENKGAMVQGFSVNVSCTHNKKYTQ